MSEDQQAPEAEMVLAEFVPQGELSRDERTELKRLSKELMGASSKWQKFVDGVPQEITREVEEVVPGENGEPDTTRKVTVPVLVNGVKQTFIKRFTQREVLDLLVEFKVKRELALAQRKALLEAQAKALAQKEAEEKLMKEIEAASGSSALA